MLNTVTAQNRSTLGKNLNNYLPVYSGDVNPIIEKVNELSNKSYKVYTALLTQSGTDAPVATVLENTIGDIVWERGSAGNYTGTLTNAFIENKTFILATLGGAEIVIISASSSINIIRINTNDTTNFIDFDGDMSIEIRVYN